MTSLSTREINISVDEPFHDDLSQEWLEEVVHQALEVALLPDQPGQVSLVIVDDATIKGLNRQFRGLDEVTDVLSFSTAHPGHWEGEDDPPGEHGGQQPDDFVFPAGEVPPLGEVIVCYPQALRQAQSQGHAVSREVALLVVHGVLHLVGHDHLEVEDSAIMKAKEQAALATLFPSGADNS
jgi:probable rRNA maturation factor